MKKTIKFYTDINTRGCGPGEFRRVSDTTWYLDTISLANEHNVTIKKIKIHDWFSALITKSHSHSYSSSHIPTSLFIISP